MTYVSRSDSSVVYGVFAMKYISSNWTVGTTSFFVARQSTYRNTAHPNSHTSAIQSEIAVAAICLESTFFLTC